MRVLLINPYIYDVSAYSFWSAPLGLLYMGSIMRRNGAEVGLLDCLEIDETREKVDGRAPFVKRRVVNPGPVRGIGKRFRRYGLSPEQVLARLAEMEPPDVVMITCIMTYWYLGAKEIAEMVRSLFPKSRIILGGEYASLCYEHAARVMGAADLVLQNFEANRLYAFVEEVCGYALSFRPDPGDLSEVPYPCFDLYERCRFVPLLTSVGCPHRCTYCATPYLQPRVARRGADDVVGEVRHWHGLGIDRFVLYDDSFLFRKEMYAKPILRAIGELPLKVSFYNPNAVNAAMIDREVARLLRGAGFEEVRLGFETADPAVQAATGGKVRTADLESALEYLRGAGFGPESLGVYVLTGLPGQPHEEVGKSLDYLETLGVRIHLAQFSPIPHTVLYEQHRGSARYPLEEPMFQNNALFPFEWDGFTEGDLNRLKQRVRERNGRLGQGGGAEGEAQRTQGLGVVG